MKETKARRNINQKLRRKGWSINNWNPAFTVFSKCDDGSTTSTDVVISANGSIYSTHNKKLKDIVINLNVYSKHENHFGDGKPYTRFRNSSNIDLTFAEFENIYKSIKELYDSYEANSVTNDTHLFHSL